MPASFEEVLSASASFSMASPPSGADLSSLPKSSLLSLELRPLISFSRSPPKARPYRLFRPPLTSRILPSLCCMSTSLPPSAFLGPPKVIFYCRAHWRFCCSTMRLPLAGEASMKLAERFSFSGEGWGGLWMPVGFDFDRF